MCVGVNVKCSYRSVSPRKRGIVCHGGDRRTEWPRSHAHGYNVGYQGEEERENQELTTRRPGHEETTLDEVSIE